MMKFYFNGSPNPTKVALMLEELGQPFDAIPVDTRKGQQFDPAIVVLNPNAKVPILVDGDTVVFDSNAILLYLAEKTGKFAPAVGSPQRGELLSWLMFVATGIGPYSGQAVHFRHFAPEKIAYANDRYQYEALRHFTVLDERLAKREWLVGDAYSIVDMAAWGWARLAPFVMGDDVWAKLPNVKRHHDTIAARPAAGRAATLKDRYPFKADWDDDARRAMFKHMKL